MGWAIAHAMFRIAIVGDRTSEKKYAIAQFSGRTTGRLPLQMLHDWQGRNYLGARVKLSIR
jgi:hypothetical protein